MGILSPLCFVFEVRKTCASWEWNESGWNGMRCFTNPNQRGEIKLKHKKEKDNYESTKKEKETSILKMIIKYV